MRKECRYSRKRLGGEKAIVLILILCAACQQSSPAGDGTLTEDRFSPSRRFVLDLGPVDLSKPSSTTFRIANLPSTAFTLGFEIVPRPPRQSRSLFGVRPISAPVRVTLVDELGRLVIDERGPLNRWVWSASPKVVHLYTEGASRAMSLRRARLRLNGLGKKSIKAGAAGSVRVRMESTHSGLTFSARIP